jgi:hypothetical protein
MKIIITESQYNRILMEEEQQEVLHIPSIKIFGGNWNLLQKFLKSKGNPQYTIGGDLILKGSSIASLGNLISVEGFLTLKGSSIESLGNLTSVGGFLDLGNTEFKSLGNLTSVGGDLYLTNSSVTSIGKLSYVGNSLFLIGTPLSKKYTEEEIRQMVNVGGNIHI